MHSKQTKTTTLMLGQEEARPQHPTLSHLTIHPPTTTIAHHRPLSHGRCCVSRAPRPVLLMGLLLW